MRRRLTASLVVLTTALIPLVEAQSQAPDVQTAGGLHTVVFRSTQGSVNVSIAADTAPGDTISGVIRLEPAGRSAAEQQTNLAALSRLVVECERQRTAVSERRYRWTIPAVLRTGRIVLALLSSDARPIAQASVPVDGVPAPRGTAAPGTDGFELPADAQAGLPAVIRGPTDGTLQGKAVRVGTTDAELLAVSPRRIVFRAPANLAGQVPLRLTAGGSNAEGPLRVMTARLISTGVPLQRDQKGTLTVVVGGLANLAAPVAVIIRNLTTQVVRMDEGDVQTVAIAPRQVQPDGTVTLTRSLTGQRPAPFQMAVIVSGQPLTVFDVPRAAERVLSTWEAATGIRITTDARTLIQRSVLEARGPLEQFLARQQANLGDPRDVFAALLSNYCFDLRDEKPRPMPRAGATDARGIRPVAFEQAQGRAPGVEIDSTDVRRLSFGESLSRLVQRFSGSSPVGYLLITSTPASAGIAVDGQRKSEMTNRRFVTSVGDHAVVITGQAKTCQQRVRVNAFQITVVACEP